MLLTMITTHRFDGRLEAKHVKQGSVPAACPGVIDVNIKAGVGREYP